MRPIHRDTCPIAGDYGNYRDAFPILVGRLGNYCSYCERRIEAGLAVEHIQPKGLAQYVGLIGHWDNFLLGCINCNGTKGDKDVKANLFYLPDRDNTNAAFEYTPDGRVVPPAHLTPAQQVIADRTLRLMGLEKEVSEVHDDNGKIVVLDRKSKRMEVWGIAQRSRSRLAKRPSDEMRDSIADLAHAEGCFSIWMTVFIDDTDMRRRLIRAFPGTAADCFDTDTTLPVSPRPNNGLLNAGKI